MLQVLLLKFSPSEGETQETQYCHYHQSQPCQKHKKFIIDSIINAMPIYLINHILYLLLGRVVAHALENGAEFLGVDGSVSVLVKYHKCIPASINIRIFQ